MFQCIVCFLAVLNSSDIVSNSDIIGQQDENGNSTLKIAKSVSALLYDMVESGSINTTYLETLSKRKSEFEGFHYYILSSTLYNQMDQIPIAELPALMNAITNFVPEPKNAFSIFHDVFLKSIKRFINVDYYQNEDLIIKTWRPFETNVTGIALYKDNRQNTMYLKDIFENESSKDINLKDLEVAGYIPYEFLQKLRENDLVEGGKGSAISMMLILNPRKFKHMWDLKENAKYIIGISIPKFCKHDKIPLLKAFFQPDSNTLDQNWTEFGNQYTDPPRYVKQLCFLSQMLFFSKLNTSPPKNFESIKRDYCNNTSSGVTTFLHDRTGLKGEFCMSKYLMLPRFDCVDDGHYKKKKEDCYVGHPVTNKTKQYYEMMLGCFQFSDYAYCNESLSTFRDVNLSYVDAMIAVYIFREIQQSPVSRYRIPPNRSEILLTEILDKSIPSLSKRNSEPHITYLIALLDMFTYYFDRNTTGIYFYRHFLYQKLSLDSPTVGMILSKNNFTSSSYEVQTLVHENSTLKHSADVNVDVIIFISDTDTSSRNYTFRDCYVFVIMDNFTEYDDHICKSKIIALSCNKRVTFTVYLRTTGDENKPSQSQGYSTIVELEPMRFKVLYVSKFLVEDRDPIVKFLIFNQDVEMADVKSVPYKNRKFAKANFRKI